jgi:hypothetical protein
VFSPQLDSLAGGTKWCLSGGTWGPKPMVKYSKISSPSLAFHCHPKHLHLPSSNPNPPGYTRLCWTRSLDPMGMSHTVRGPREEGSKGM